MCVSGDAAVGKSSSVERFVKNEFFEFQQPTIGAAFLTQTVQLEDCIVKFEIVRAMHTTQKTQQHATYTYHRLILDASIHKQTRLCTQLSY